METRNVVVGFEGFSSTCFRCYPVGVLELLSYMLPIGVIILILMVRWTRFFRGLISPLSHFGRLIALFSLSDRSGRLVCVAGADFQSCLSRSARSAASQVDGLRREGLRREEAA